jgi:hypothetical protein
MNAYEAGNNVNERSHARTVKPELQPQADQGDIDLRIVSSKPAVGR